MKKTIIALMAVLVLASIPVQSLGQENTVRPVKVDTPPRLDGRLDEPFWNTIEPITDFRQQEPNDGDPASERTEVRIAYDSHHLYFGIRAFDSNPSRLIRSVYERDGVVLADDSILIGIDSNDDNRTAFVFVLNTLGARTDMEVTEDLMSANTNWDCIWEYRAAVDSEGYTIEASIPLFVLRFSAGDVNDMGLLLRRNIRYKNEIVHWPYISRSYTFYSASQFGTLAGLEGLERGKNLEIKPYAIAGYSDVRGEGDDYEADAGLDVKWGVTPNFTMDLTANTDFAQVESDALQVNLTRFSLYYPEKREFFIESSQLFQFGLPRRAEAFFSRTIGIRGNQEVPIIGGARAYGLMGDTNIGLMTMQTDASGGYDGENFTVGRVKHNVLGRSYIGAIATSRRGIESMEDTTVGFDYTFLFGDNIRTHGQVARSDGPGDEEGNWFASFGAMQYSDAYIWEVRYDDIGENYNPGVGFVNRHDQRRTTLYGEWTPRPGWPGIRQIRIGHTYRRIENHAGILETQTHSPNFGIRFNSEDSLVFYYEDTYDFIPYTFYLTPDVYVAGGEHTNRQFSVEVDTNSARKIDLYGYTSVGSFYSGDIIAAYLSINFKPKPWLHITLADNYNDVELPGGNFDSHITQLYLSYYLSPTLSTRVAAQYSSLYEELVFNFRARWIYAPGSEAWLVYNEGRRFDLPDSSLTDRAVILKIVYNFNF